MSNTAACFAIVFHNEGGYTDNAKDPGNWTGNRVGEGVLVGTNMGISAPTLMAVLGHIPSPEEMKALTPEAATSIYAKNYYPAWCDHIPLALAICAVDAGVMSGPGRAAKWLQKALGVPVDGAIGQVSIGRANSCDLEETVHAFTDARIAFLKSLPTWPMFGNGWNTRCIYTEDAAIAAIPMGETK